jgi:hypothetical protein
MFLFHRNLVYLKNCKHKHWTDRKISTKPLDFLGRTPIRLRPSFSKLTGRIFFWDFLDQSFFGFFFGFSRTDRKISTKPLDFLGRTPIRLRPSFSKLTGRIFFSDFLAFYYLSSEGFFFSAGIWIFHSKS